MIKKILNFLKRQFHLSSVPKPHAVKEAMIREYKKYYGINILIETGTYMGEMVEAMKNSFEKIYSIELNEELYQKVAKKFAKDSNVSILHGDSGDVLPSLLKNITEPALFWLDGHYSGGVTSKGNFNTPIKNEIESIFKHPNKNHVILIDDARLFNGTNDYPTYKEVSLIAQKNGYASKKENDIIVICRP